MSNKRSLNSDSFGFYFAPLISSISFFIIYSGEFYDKTHSITISGFRARLLGLVFLLIAIFIIFDFIKKNLKNSESHIQLKYILKLFFKSAFCYVWLISSVILIIAYILKVKFLLYGYGILLISCFYFQFRFVKIIAALKMNEKNISS